MVGGNRSDRCLAVLDLRLKREIILLLPFEVAVEKAPEPFRHRDCSRLVVLQAESRRILQMGRVALQIEEENSRLDDLILPQTGIETGEKDELQVVVLLRLDQFIPLRFRAEDDTRRLVNLSKLEIRKRVDTANLLLRVKKGPERADMDLRSRLGYARLQRLIVVARQFCGDGDQGTPLNALSELPQNCAMHTLGSARIEVQTLFLRQIFLNAPQVGGRFVGKTMLPKVVRPGDRFDRIRRVQRDETALPVALNIQPEDIAALVNASGELCRLLMSHITVTFRSKTQAWTALLNSVITGFSV